MKRLIGLATVAACLAAAGPAAADSISYLKDGNVWLTTPDGSRQVPLTTSGGYSFASQADDGTVIALYGQRLHRIARDGRILADFDTPVSDSDGTAGSHFSGPFSPAVSPDGKKVAYNYFWTLLDPTNPGCLPPTCISTRTEGGIAYSHADRQTSWDEPGMGRQSGWIDAAWIDDEHTLLADKTVRYGNLDLFVDTMGDGPTTTLQWFSDDASWYMRDPEMSRQHTKVAVLGTTPDETPGGVGSDDDQVRIYRMNGEAPALPEACYYYGPASGKYESPSWSPDGSRIAFTDTRQGLMVADVPDFGGGCAMPSAGASLLIGGASNPDWGPADVPAPGQGGGGDGGKKGGGKKGAAKGKLGLKLAKSVALGKAVRKGIVVTVDGGGPGKASAKALRGRKVQATGAAKAGPKGKAAVKLTFTRKAVKKLKGKRSVALKVSVAFKPAAGGAAMRSAATVLLKR